MKLFNKKIDPVWIMFATIVTMSVYERVTKARGLDGPVRMDGNSDMMLAEDPNYGYGGLNCTYGQGYNNADGSFNEGACQYTSASSTGDGYNVWTSSINATIFGMDTTQFDYMVIGNYTGQEVALATLKNKFNGGSQGDVMMALVNVSLNARFDYLNPDQTTDVKFFVCEASQYNTTAARAITDTITVGAGAKYFSELNCSDYASQLR